MRAATIGNFCITNSVDLTQKYKQHYFVNWPVLNKYKQQLF